ncbi:MAG: YdcF family protein [Herbinix sp.]|nr:YdcF family protein [Herbinix sp.]
MNFLFWLVLSLSVLSLLYCCVIIVYSGIDTTFSRFWLAAGIVGLLACILMRYMMIHEIEAVGSFRFLVTLIIIVGLSIFTYLEGTLIYHANRKAEQGMDYIIILGAQVRGTIITKTLLKRLNMALAYMKDNPRTVAIVSGGRGENEALSEAEAMGRYLMKKGIIKNRIIKEDKSKNTFENILYSKSFLKPNSSVAIVTNGFHIYRSISIAKKQGLNQIQGLAAPTDHLLAVNYYVREAIGVIKDKLLGNL